MKKFIFATVTVVGGYIAFLKIHENMQRQAVWHQVSDRVE